MASCYQIVVELARNEPIPGEQLEDLAEACLDALNREARFIALGPVVSANFDRTAIEAEFTAGGESVEEINKKVERVTEILRAAIAAHDGDDDTFAYSRSTAERLTAA